MVVDDGGDATVGVDLQVIRSLMLALAEVEVDRFVCQPEFFENDCNFPENRVGFQTALNVWEGGDKRTSRWVHPYGCTR